MYPASTRFFTHVATGQIREEPPVYGYARFKHRLTGKARVACVFIPPRAWEKPAWNRRFARRVTNGFRYPDQLRKLY